MAHTNNDTPLTGEARKQAMGEIIIGTESRMLRDIDVRDHTHSVSGGMRALLGCCDILAPEHEGKRDEYTSTLVSQFLIFSGALDLGGPLADYCASNALGGVGSWRLRLTGTPEASRIVESVMAGIRAHALYPGREVGRLIDAGIIAGEPDWA